MEIREKIENDFKEALKKRDKVVVSTLRMLKSALHNKEIEKRGEKLQDAEVVKVVTKQVQQHKDSIEQFKKGNRPELAEKEAQELEVLKKYLPRQLSAQEITAIVEKVIAETGAKEKSDFGKVMKSVMAELKGSSQGKMVSQIVSARLCPDKEKS
ncbi:MAG: GatB/YqeY domain-containing protein [Candidatus Omnitrophica bacterium]|nr:GatB/YqeY domain-containing protein [Candidatus Omnitrophota bacterium]